MEFNKHNTPFTYQKESDTYTHIVRGESNEFICQLSQDTSGLSESRARLFAAAPELLAALQRVYKAAKEADLLETLGEEEHEYMKAAITKALTP